MNRYCVWEYTKPIYKYDPVIIQFPTNILKNLVSINNEMKTWRFIGADSDNATRILGDTIVEIIAKSNKIP